MKVSKRFDPVLFYFVCLKGWGWNPGQDEVGVETISGGRFVFAGEMSGKGLRSFV